jgi:saccharopine dehydrogenase (NADP+, L-glutamate forming)
VIEAKEPLKVVENRDEFTVSMKLEVYPNRDSMVFLDRFNMKDCETFVRGTIRFRGYSYIISAFHDLGLTSDNLLKNEYRNWRELLNELVGDGDVKKCN